VHLSFYFDTWRTTVPDVAAVSAFKL